MPRSGRQHNLTRVRPVRTTLRLAALCLVAALSQPPAAWSQPPSVGVNNAAALPEESSAGEPAPHATSELETRPLGRPNSPLSARPVAAADDEVNQSPLWSTIDPRRNDLTRVLGALAAVVGLLLERGRLQLDDQNLYATTFTLQFADAGTTRLFWPFVPAGDVEIL